MAWNWGGGWLKHNGFQDFAGTTTVHLVGGAAALWGSIIVGPRLDKKLAKTMQEREALMADIEIDYKEVDMANESIHSYNPLN